MNDTNTSCGSKEYRKRAVCIRAIQWNGTWEQAGEIIRFCEGQAFQTTLPTGHYLYIKAPEGDMMVSPKDYVIRGIKGEYYRCKPDIFEASYDEIIYNPNFDDRGY
jgi:hypothetical protein